MNEDQFKRIEALLLLNSFLLMRPYNPTAQASEAWLAVAKNYENIFNWLKNNCAIDSFSDEFVLPR